MIFLPRICQCEHPWRAYWVMGGPWGWCAQCMGLKAYFDMVTMRAVDVR